MIPKDIEQITEADLQALVDNSVRERKTLDYKQSLPGRGDSDKREFLADVSSFANASGGDLIYGIVADGETGEPTTLKGVAVHNTDEEIRRLDSMIRDGIRPRIMGTGTRAVPLSSSKTACVIIRVPKSWMSPHRVTFKAHDKFYSRSTNGKYPLDVDELRAAFAWAESVAERIRTFREDRLSKILAGETPVPLCENPKTALHLVPTISFRPGQRYDLRPIASGRDTMKGIGDIPCAMRYNVDGLLAYDGDDPPRASYCYVQLFRSGVLEAVDAFLLDPGTQQLIPSVWYEQALIASLGRYLSILRTLGVELPLFLFLTVLGAQGYKMGITGTAFGVAELHAIDREVLLLPEVLVEDYDAGPERLLRPCFDSLWNACGFPGSWNYDEEGNWREHTQRKRSG